MTRTATLCSLVLLAATAGCALPPADPNTADREEPVYVTGSNIPKKQRGPQDGVSVMNRQDAERAQNAQLPTTGTPMR